MTAKEQRPHLNNAQLRVIGEITMRDDLKPGQRVRLQDLYPSDDAIDEGRRRTFGSLVTAGLVECEYQGAGAITYVLLPGLWEVGGQRLPPEGGSLQSRLRPRLDG